MPSGGRGAGAPRGRVLTGGLPSPLAAAQAGRTGRARFTFQNIHEALTSDGICDRAGLIAPASPSFSLSRSAPFVHTRLLSRPSSGSSPCPRIADLSPSSCLRVRMSCLSELGRRWRWGRPAWALCCLFCFRSLDFSTLYSKQPEWRIQDSCFLPLPTEPRARQWSVMDVV